MLVNNNLAKFPLAARVDGFLRRIVIDTHRWAPGRGAARGRPPVGAALRVCSLGRRRADIRPAPLARAACSRYDVSALRDRVRLFLSTLGVRLLRESMKEKKEEENSNSIRRKFRRAERASRGPNSPFAGRVHTAAGASFGPLRLDNFPLSAPPRRCRRGPRARTFLAHQNFRAPGAQRCRSTSGLPAGGSDPPFRLFRERRANGLRPSSEKVK